MTQLSREECIELGASIPTGPLTGWAADQHTAAAGWAARLGSRGIQPSYLEEIESLVEQVTHAQGLLGCGSGRPPAGIVRAQRIREEAFASWREAKQIVNVRFGADPEFRATFRLGERTGRLVANLKRELDCIVSLLGAHSAQLGWLGVTETFQRVGGALIGRLREAQGMIDSACRGLSPALAEQSSRKGRLYDLTRKLVRVGRLEFVHEPELAAAFNYSVFRRGLLACVNGGFRPVRTAVR